MFHCNQSFQLECNLYIYLMFHRFYIYVYIPTYIQWWIDLKGKEPKSMFDFETMNYTQNT